MTVRLNQIKIFFKSCPPELCQASCSGACHCILIKTYQMHLLHLQFCLILNAFQPFPTWINLGSTWTDLPLSLRGFYSTAGTAMILSPLLRLRPLAISHSALNLCPSSVLCKVGMATCLRWNEPFDTVF